MKSRFVPTLAACLMLGACDTSAPTETPLIDLQSADARNVAANRTSTQGGGKAELPAGFSALQFAFSAFETPQGGAHGHFHQSYESANGTVDFAGRVTCVSVDPVNHRVWVGGVITHNKSTNPARIGVIFDPGHDVWFRVVDNGSGPDAMDRTTVFGFEGGGGILTSAEYCQRQLWTANDANTWPVTHGMIKVNP